MKILVIGGGGREHTLVWKISQSPLVRKIYCAPGNAGISSLAECLPISPTHLSQLARFAKNNEIDLTVVGPEVPLVEGIVDEFQAQGLRIFGPSKEAAQIEGSKAFAKDFMKKYGIPTADYRIFEDRDQAVNYVRKSEVPLVVKADGLAAGKGSIVCHTHQEALAAIDKIMVQRVFGESGNKVVIEEYLKGEEASVLALTDGSSLHYFSPAQDHKPVYDGDKGPNTGGMGAYAPAPVVDPLMMEEVKHKIFEPAIRGMASEGWTYRGVLYAGLMITEEGPKVLEFNCRFGDPESQVTLPLMKSDLVEAMVAVIEGRLSDFRMELLEKWAVCVVMASGGYPGHYEKGKQILGLDRDWSEDILIFHAGTKFKDGKIITDGGRVLGVTALGENVRSAIDKTYEAVAKISFEGAHFRRDIGHKALKRM